MPHQFINTKMNLMQWTTLIILSVIWGASFFFMEIILVEISSFELVFYRLCIASIVLWIIMFGKRLYRKKYNKYLPQFFLMGLFNNAIPFSLIAWGQTYINSSLASIFNATVPFFTIIIAGFLLADERITVGKIIGVCVGFIGVIYSISFDIAGSGINVTTLGQFAILIAAMFYAIATIYGRKFKGLQVSPMVIATMQISIATLILGVYIALSDNSFMISVSTPVLFSLLGLGIISTAIAYILYFYILETAGAVNISLVTFLVPLSAIFLGVIFLGESLNINHIIGAICIIFGLIIIDGRIWAKVQIIIAKYLNKNNH